VAGRAWSTHAAVSARLLAAATLSGRGARVYTCTCVNDNIPCRRLPKYKADRHIPTYHKPLATMLLKWSVRLDWGRSSIFKCNVSQLRRRQTDRQTDRLTD